MTTQAHDLRTPAHSHTPWCRNHADGGTRDQRCIGEPWELRARVHATARIYMELDQYSTRGADDPAWDDQAPTIQILAEQDGYLGFVDLALAEARQVVGELLNLIELAEAQTGRCPR